MNLFNSTKFLVGVIALASLLYGCSHYRNSDQNLGLQIQKGTEFVSFKEKIAGEYGLPINAQSWGFDGGSGPLELKNVDQIWKLFAESPCWHETAQSNDYCQGLSPCLPITEFVEFTLVSDSGKSTRLRIEIRDSAAMCFVQGGEFYILDISKNRESILRAGEAGQGKGVTDINSDDS